MAQRIIQVDAFTDRPFGGNPAAVCVLDEERPDGWMQAVASEMNLSETAFLRRERDGSWRLCWFTPVAEVDLCGHATLASAHVLWQHGHADPAAPLRFATLSGELAARREGDGAIVLDFPAEPASAVTTPAGLLEALGIGEAAVESVARNRMDLLVQLGSATEVQALRPDPGALRRIPMRGLIVTARTAPGDVLPAPAPVDFVSRFFCPGLGIDEDPVTGSAHCCLAPWWAERIGRTELAGWQASARGGLVRVRMLGARVELIGHAVTVLRGELVEQDGAALQGISLHGRKRTDGEDPED